VTAEPAPEREAPQILFASIVDSKTPVEKGMQKVSK
jgi:hypothetical protein